MAEGTNRYWVVAILCFGLGVLLADVACLLTIRTIPPANALLTAATLLALSATMLRLTWWPR